MSKRLVWDQATERLYENGIDMPVLFVHDPETGVAGAGVPWNGFTGMAIKPTGAESTKNFANNKVYLNLMSDEEVAGTATAYTYPDEWKKCEGSEELAPGVYIAQQARAVFSMAWRTIVGNDTKLNAYGSKLHILYQGLAAPSEKAYKTVNTNVEAIEFSWEITTTPIEVEGFKPTAMLTIDTSKMETAMVTALMDALYGSETTESKLLLPSDVLAIVKPTKQASTK